LTPLAGISFTIAEMLRKGQWTQSSLVYTSQFSLSGFDLRVALTEAAMHDKG
jgi:hypothetical protein